MLMPIDDILVNVMEAEQQSAWLGTDVWALLVFFVSVEGKNSSLQPELRAGVVVEVYRQLRQLKGQVSFRCTAEELRC
jgi:hypothetical protein